MLYFSWRDKYRLPKTKTKSAKQVCRHCGKEQIIEYAATLPRPNTTRKVVKGLIGPMPGTFLGCLFGNHDFYFEDELELNKPDKLTNKRSQQ